MLSFQGISKLNMPEIFIIITALEIFLYASIMAGGGFVFIQFYCDKALILILVVTFEPSDSDLDSDWIL